MRRRTLFSIFALLTLAVANSTAAYQTVPANQAAGWGPLADGVTFTEIDSGTPDELTAFASIARVSRETWKEDLYYGGLCYDMNSGGPDIMMVESGHIRVGLSELNSEAEVQPANALPVVVHRPDDPDTQSEAVLMVPDSQTDLGPGDYVVLPNGSICSIWIGSTPADLLILNPLPGIEPISMAGDAIRQQDLDINLGLNTVNPAVPPAVVAGRLFLDVGATQTLGTTASPLAVLVETGTAALTLAASGGLLRTIDPSGTERHSAILPDQEVILNPGDAVYLPPGVAGSLSVTGESSTTLLSIALDATRFVEE